MNRDDGGEGWAWFGTLIWLGGWFFYFVFMGGARHAHDDLKVNEVADIFNGLAAPVAFLWLVLGYRTQRKELENQREELAAQRKAIQDTEIHARRDSFIQVREIAVDNLTTLGYRCLWKLFEGWGYDNKSFTDGHMKMIRDRVSQGERHVLFDEIIHAFHKIIGEKRANVEHLLEKNPQAKDAATEFVNQFEFLLELASNADKLADSGPADAAQHVTRRLIQTSRMAQLYAAFCISLGRPIKAAPGENWPRTIGEIRA